MSLTRRDFLQLSAAVSLFPVLRDAAAADSNPRLEFGPARPFDFDALVARAREMAGREYVQQPEPDPAIVRQIDYDAHGKLKFRKEAALWAKGGGAYPITFQHVGMFFPRTVKMNAVERGQSREIKYDPRLFAIGPEHVASGLGPEPSAFAGFWVHERRAGPDWKQKEPWVTFLGASYFRGVGDLGQVGLSARGLAIAPGTTNPEEFPYFVEFWFEGAPKPADPVIVYALLDSPSVAGAYRFALTRTRGVVMTIDARLFLRKSIERFGIAPLTSMYWFSETAKPQAVDWRPEVHDSDGLAMLNGQGEHLWRPLNNPPQVQVSSFHDRSPRGFGLVQRDRVFDHYQDGVRYHLRPSAWVEPLSDWGEGAVQLTEIPTDDEIHDNVVAMWVPAEPAAAGKRFDFRYKLYWQAEEPFAAGALARCVATRLGNGGQPGKPRPKGVRKFMVEFLGAPLAKIPYGQKPEPVISATRGELSRIEIEAVPDDVPGHWRTHFDLAATGPEPVELRCFLKLGGAVVTETWLFQYHPFGPGA